ncbi:unnamed protein product, partial [Mesorhabditis belari]|uniref:C-type lectin domain-containing protein n=1 Tax=Mesorhabditis belari TaxID=2138241 RepID=A0AAF3EQB3_9BILA
MGVMAVGLFITILLLFHQISSSIQQSNQLDQFTDSKVAEMSRTISALKADLKTQNTEVRDGKAKIGELERKINALQSKNSDLETQIQFERENKTIEIAKLHADLNRTMNLLNLYRDGWSYLAKTASWYKVIDQEITFDEAEAYCASRKSHLVTIHSQEENDFVQELAETVHSTSGFWIGLKRNPNQGKALEWTDGSSVDFTNWYPGEPASRTHSTLLSHDGKWQVIVPTHQRYFICKRSSQF